jgi:hypothetical protein
MTKQPAPPSKEDPILPPSWFPGPVALLAGAILLLALVKPLLPLTDQATGRHLALGRIMVEKQQIPQYDQLGFLYTDREYLDFEWLFNAGSWLIFTGLGLDSLVFLTFILFSLTLCVMLRHLLDNGVSMPVALTGIVMLSAANYVHLLARPIIFTYFFLTLVIWLWTKILLHRGKKNCWWLPFIFLLWANIHPGFASGLLFMGLSLLGAMWEQRDQGFQKFKFAWILLGICSLVTLINPYGWKLHALIVHQVFHSKSLNQIQEFLPPDFLHPNGAVSALALVLLSILIVILRRKEKIGMQDLLPALVFLFFAIKVQRHILLLLPVVLLPLCRVWDQWLFSLFHDFWKKRADRYTAIALHARADVFWVLAAMVAAGFFFHQSFSPHLRIGSNSFTPQAEEFVRQNLGLFRRPFTSTVQAGNLLFYFHPDLKVSFDDRVDFYQDADCFAHLAAVNGEKGWIDFFKQHAFDSAILYPTDPLVEKLQQRPDWQEIYADPGLVVFKAR